MIKETIKHYVHGDSKIEHSGNNISFEVPAAEIQKVISDLYIKKKLQFKFVTATNEKAGHGCYKIWYFFHALKENLFVIPYIKLVDTDEFPSVASLVHEAWDHERKIHTFYGLTPIGHPDLRQIIMHENWPADIFPLRKDFNLLTRPETSSGIYKFQKVKGEGIYEVSVGPIHAGIIEPGYFKISAAGEMIVLIEPRLGFTHKGIEKLFETLPLKQKICLAEKISGDSSFSHSLAFCQALEQLSNIQVPKRMRYLRVIFAELERIANHCGDIGAIMLDTGYNFGGSNGARLREIIMQINERLTGSRFLRGVNAVGGVTKDINSIEINRLLNDLAIIGKDFSEIVEIVKNSSSLLNRLKGTGILSSKLAKDRGVYGIAAKALGIQRDVRIDSPYAAYDELVIEKVEIEEAGDVYARFNVRIKEVYASIKIIQTALHQMPENLGNLPENISLRANSYAIHCVEGWRGEILYFITTDSDGNISRVAPRDPSFINWGLLRNSAFDNIIPDFPLINKSFNLSYSGNDL